MKMKVNLLEKRCGMGTIYMFVYSIGMLKAAYGFMIVEQTVLNGYSM